jgi:hypothetical protein
MPKIWNKPPLNPFNIKKDVLPFNKANENKKNLTPLQIL